MFEQSLKMKLTQTGSDAQLFETEFIGDVRGQLPQNQGLCSR